MKISVIIPVYRNWDGLSDCLASLCSQHLSLSDYEVIVVNNDVTHPPPVGYRLPPNCRLLDEQRKGSYAARNAGVREARAEYLCFTDSDCVPDTGWLRAIYEIFERHPEVSRIGGPMPFICSAVPCLAELHDTMSGYSQENAVRHSGWAATANMATRRSVFDAVGLFNEKLLSGGDCEWGMRAEDAGFPIVFAPDVIVRHKPRQSLREIIIRERRLLGGYLDLKMRRKGRLGLAWRYLLTLPIKLLPSVKGTMGIIGHREISIGNRVRLALFAHCIRLARAAEAFRVIFLLGERERR
jgi:GT2 family glycosyltransferase